MRRPQAALARLLRSMSDWLEVPLDQSPFMLEARVVEAAASGGSHDEAMAAVVRVINEGWEESVVQLARSLARDDQPRPALDDVFTIPRFAAGGRYDDFQNLTQSSKLDLLEQQQRIQAIERSLRDRETYGKGKKKRTRLSLRGLDRRVAEEQLKDERRELERMKRENKELRNYGTPAQEKARDEAEQAAAKAAEEREQAAEDQRRAIASASGDITGQLSLSGISSAAGLERALDRVKADSAAFTLVLADLAGAGASQWVLDVLKKAGPSRSSIKVGRELLKDTARLARISASSAALAQVGGIYADLTAGSGTLSGANRELLVQIQALDVTQVTGEIQRVVRHELASIGTGAGI